MATVRDTDTVYVDLRPSSDVWSEFWSEDDSKKRPQIFLLNRLGDFYSDARLALQGKIQFVENSVDEGTGTVLVRTEFHNPNQLFRAGEILKTLVVQSFQDQILIPHKYLGLDDNHEHYVIIAEASAQKDKWKLRKQSVKTLFPLGDKWSVQGLKPGEIIVLPTGDTFLDPVALSSCQ